MNIDTIIYDLVCLFFSIESLAVLAFQFFRGIYYIYIMLHFVTRVYTYLQCYEMLHRFIHIKKK